MTVSIRIPGADFSKFFDYAHIPYVEDAQSFYLFGTDAASSQANQIAGATQPTASLIGTPTYGNGFANISGTANGFDTGYTGGAGPFTLILLHQSVSSGAGVFGFRSAAANKAYFFAVGDDIYWNADGSIRLTWTTAPGYASGKFSLTAFTYSGTTLTAYRSQGTATLASSSANYTAGAVAAAPLRIGGLGDGSGAMNAAAAASFTRVLTADELSDVYDYFKFIMPARGIAVN